MAWSLRLKAIQASAVSRPPAFIVKLGEIATRLHCRLDGEPEVEIHRVAGIEEAGPGDLTFFANPRYSSSLQTTRASAVILGEQAPPAPCAMLRTRNPYVAFADALTLFIRQVAPEPGIDPRAAVHGSATVGAEVAIAAFVFIDQDVAIGDRTVIYPNVTIGRGARIGSDCVIHSNVSVREHVRIGHRVIIQNGASIGSDGYGFARREDGTHHKIPQSGAVIIEDDVEIGANTAIDRPAVGETRIKSGTKIDNLVQIGHGVIVGRNVLLAAQVGIAGSTRVGDGVVLAGQVGVAGHIRIGDRAVAAGQSGITNSVDSGAFVSGYPAIDNREWLKASVIFRKLPEIRKSIGELERRVAELEAQLDVARRR